jgi:hypothetical protein
METLYRWIIGFVFSLVIGQFATKYFMGWLHSYLGFDPQWREKNIGFGQRLVPSWLMGLLERLFFTILVAFDVSALSPGIMTWLLIKMASNWNRINPPRKDFMEPEPPKPPEPPDMLKPIPLSTDAQNERKILQKEARLRAYAMSSLLGSLVSMLFALLGGLICSGKICSNFIR